ncbi:MAG: McrC family protein [Polynucleobacter sp.]|nr:McrC family protein [Polynucleobacter sp.]
MKSVFSVREYGVISDGIIGSLYSDDSIEIDKESFESLSNFIEENIENINFDNAFSIFKKKGRRHIRVKNYVGAIETKQGVVIEILPKTYNNNIPASDSESKFLLLNLLRTLSDSPFLNLNIAHLNVVDNFPILEIFITSYLDELERTLSFSLRGDYHSVQENTSFIKGKLLITENIKRNAYKRHQFFCAYDVFSENIPPNKLIKSTLKHLLKISKISKNKTKIVKFMNIFENVDFTQSLNSDLNYCKSRSKFLVNYSNLIKWSEIYLQNKSFTNFHGGSINQAILFPMEKLFENYIAYLIKKYCNGLTISSQDKKYSLIGQKSDIYDQQYVINKFLLRPDIVINYDSVIIDTKWKMLDVGNKRFGIQESDVYQMHAYGRRYQSGNSSKLAPRLGLIYPKNPDFDKSLSQMRYGDDLLLDVLPFDLSNKRPDLEIEKIVQIFMNNSILEH